MKKSFNTINKQSWRNFILSRLTPESTHSIVNEDGTLPYRWLEPVGHGAFTFDSLLSTGKIKESQLIGIDKNPYNENDSIQNVNLCRSKFKDAQFFCDYWDFFCLYKATDDIGYIIHDLYDSCYGRVFEKNLRATSIAVENSYKNIGEVLLVVNADLDASKRYGRSGSIDAFIRTIMNVFSEREHPNIRNINLDRSQIYIYKQSSDSDTMISAHIIFH